MPVTVRLVRRAKSASPKKSSPLVNELVFSPELEEALGELRYLTKRRKLYRSLAAQGVSRAGPILEQLNKECRKALDDYPDDSPKPDWLKWAEMILELDEKVAKGLDVRSSTFGGLAVADNLEQQKDSADKATVNPPKLDSPKSI